MKLFQFIWLIPASFSRSIWFIIIYFCFFYSLSRSRSFALALGHHFTVFAPTVVGGCWDIMKLCWFRELSLDGMVRVCVLAQLQFTLISLKIVECLIRSCWYGLLHAWYFVNVPKILCVLCTWVFQSLPLVEYLILWGFFSLCPQYGLLFFDDVVVFINTNQLTKIRTATRKIGFKFDNSVYCSLRYVFLSYKTPSSNVCVCVLYVLLCAKFVPIIHQYTGTINNNTDIWNVI